MQIKGIFIFGNFNSWKPAGTFLEGIEAKNKMQKTT